MTYRGLFYGLYALLHVVASFGLPPKQQPLSIEKSPGILEVVHELKKAEIIPTVIDDFFPSLLLSVEWSKSEADLGNTIKPNKVQKSPRIELNDIRPWDTQHACLSNLTYTVVLTDPDAPSRDNPEWSEFCHWIVTGVSITSPTVRCDRVSNDGASQTGLKEIVAYKPPGPPPKTGKHRYVFLAFAARNGTSIPLNLTKPSERKHWGTGEERHGVRQWAAANELVPVAANFIYAQNKKQ